MNQQAPDQPYDLILGSHLPMCAPHYFTQTVQTAIVFGESAFMIFTGPPQSTTRIPLDKLNLEEGQSLWIKHGNQMHNLVVHCPYIINPATSDQQKQRFCINFLYQDLLRTSQMGIKYYVIHPGKYMDADLTTGIKNCAFVLNEVLKVLGDDVDICICLETMAGLGTDIASTFTNINRIIVQINDRSKIGVCIDTCHIWDAGYDVNDIDNVLTEFDNAIGLPYLKVIHLNDSKNGMKSHKDRHENLGYGQIGFNTLLKWAWHPLTNHVIKILETPAVNGIMPYKEEVSMIKNKKFDDWIKDEY